MNLATWSIRNPIPAILFFTLMTLAGFWGFKNLAIKNFPDNFQNEKFVFLLQAFVWHYLKLGRQFHF